MTGPDLRRFPDADDLPHLHALVTEMDWTGAACRRRGRPVTRQPSATPPDPDDDTDPGWLFTAPADNPGSETL